MSRASAYTPEIALEILTRFAGGEFIKSICRDAHMPHRDTVYSWLADERPQFAEFRTQFKIAEIAHSYALVDDAVEIADDGSRDVKTVKREDGSEYETTDYEVIARSKLRVDLRMKIAERRAPAVFGASVAVTGANGGPIQMEDTGDDGTRDLARRLAFTLAAGLRAAQAKQIESSAEEVSDEAETFAT